MTIIDMILKELLFRPKYKRRTLLFICVVLLFFLFSLWDSFPNSIKEKLLELISVSEHPTTTSIEKPTEHYWSGSGPHVTHINPNIPQYPRKGKIVVRACGIGAASSNITNPTLAKRAALIAAKADAKRNLSAWINGENLEAVTVITDGMFTRDQIVETFRGHIRGAKVLSQQYNDDGTVEVQMEIELDDQ